MNIRSALAGTAVALAVLVGFGSQTVAQEKGKSRPLTSHQLMEGLVKPQMTALSTALNGAGPADEKAWKGAATAAALLNESSHVMMADGRAPDSTWEEACKQLDEGTKAVLARIAAKDVAGAREGMRTVAQSCGTCHKAHKK